jgi:hypothetical protein
MYNSVDSAEFEDDVDRLKEFTRYRLSHEETVPRHPGDLMMHQRLISTFINPHTPYDGLLLVHEMGSRVYRKKSRLCHRRNICGAFYDASHLVQNTMFVQGVLLPQDVERVG